MENASVNAMLDELRKLVQLLFIAHGAVIVGALSVLKDYSSISQLKGMGLFVSGSCIGLTAVVIAYMGTFVVRLGQITATNRNEPYPGVPIIMTVILTIGIVSSGGLLIFELGAISSMFRAF